MRDATALGMPLVDQGLKLFTTRQQGAVFWRQL